MAEVVLYKYPIPVVVAVALTALPVVNETALTQIPDVVAHTRPVLVPVPEEV